MSIALPRITARVDADIQALLAQAAAIAGIPSINAFVLSAAVEKAKLILEQERVLKLSQHDALLLAQALDKPPEAHPRLRQAAARYRVKSTT